jgi:predicted house-cleaning noncanonical NTP pyrophosphatase (MazG superfamily)
MQNNLVNAFLCFSKTDILLCVPVFFVTIEGTSMKTFLHNRLWRSHMIDQWRDQGHVVNSVSISDEAFKKALLEKLIEEINEVVDAKSNDEITKELADVYEVIDVIIAAYGFSRDAIIKYQEQKRADRGTFTKNSFVKTFSPRANSDQERYCLKNVHRAPEILGQKES